MINACLESLIIAIFFLVSLAEYGDGQDRNKYSVPEPKIEVFAKGFRVSIPDQEGLNLFAFHGNINTPMRDLEAGQYSKDILEKYDGHWVFENTIATLKEGDKIYYWLFVIRFNLGYRYDNGKFVVKEISPYKPLKNDPQPPSSENTHKDNWYFEPIDKLTPSCNPKMQISLQAPQSTQAPQLTSSNSSTVSVPEHKPVSTCCQLFLNMSQQFTVLSEQIDRLMEENKILSDIAEKDDHYSTTLRIFGKYPTDYYPTPKEFAENFISENLKLVGIKVREAEKIPDNGISFKVETVNDKVKIIIAARVQLKGSNYNLSW